MSDRRLLVALSAIAACDRPSAPPPGADEPVAAVRAASLDPPVGPGATSPNLIGMAGEVALTWLEPVAGAPAEHRLRFARLSRTGWTPPATIAQGASVIANWVDVPSIARTGGGTLVAHWAERTALPDGHGYDVVIARSVDGGAAWQRLGAPHRDGTDTEHGFASLIPDGDAVIAFWLDGRAMARGQTGATALRAARIGDTIGEEQLIDDRVCDCCRTSAAVTSAGPVVVYRDRTMDELRDPWLVRRVGDTWGRPRPVHADGWRMEGCPVNGPKIAATGEHVAVAWYTRAGERASVWTAFSSDAGQTFDRPVEIDAARGEATPLGHVDIVIDRPGEVLVSWVVAQSHAVHLRLRRIARDRRRSSALELATVSAGRGGVVPRLARSGDDLVMAWADPGAGTVRVTRVALAEVPPVTTADP